MRAILMTLTKTFLLPVSYAADITLTQLSPVAGIITVLLVPSSDMQKLQNVLRVVHLPVASSTAPTR
jgi:hypothetical protein